MLKLRCLLLSNKLFYIITLITIIATTIRINIPIKSTINNNTKEITGKITSINYDGNELTLIIKINYQEQVKGYYYFKTLDELNSIKDSLFLGKRVRLKGQVKQINRQTIENTFSYKNYLKIKHINYLFDINNIEILSNHIGIIYKIKNLVLTYLSYFKSGSYIKMLLLGDTSFVSVDVINSFRENGISHLFAISGTQVTVLAEVIIKLLEKCKIKEKRRYIIVNIIIFIYMLLTGSPPAILRAVIFFFLSSINKYNYFYVTNINLFLLTLSITLLINPYFIYDLGFLYSYSISMALILCSNILENKKFIYQLFLTSFISFLVSIPITLYNFYQLNFMSILYNLFYVPFVNNILFPLAIATVFFYPLDYLMTIFINILEKSSLLISKIQIGKVIFPKLNISYYILYIIVLVLIYKFRKKIIGVLFSILLIFHYSFYNIFNNNYIYMFDVGQGDCILLHLNNQNILIDTGGIESYKREKWMKKENENKKIINSLIPYFKSKGIRKIHYLLISHGDFDHMGEATNLINNYKVDNVIFNCGIYNNLERKLIKVLKKEKISYYQNVEKLDLEDNTIYFLNTRIYNNENDNSNVIYFKYKKYKFLFMGDASKEKEEDILKEYNIENVDVLKVGHHGSNTSSSKDFINSISPKYSLISVGKNNKYNHPSKVTLKNLTKSVIYRTDLDGSILIKLNKNNYKIYTSIDKIEKY